MPLISKPNYNQIFASQAPEQDKPDTLQAMGKYLAN